MAYQGGYKRSEGLHKSGKAYRSGTYKRGRADKREGVYKEVYERGGGFIREVGL